MKRRINDRAKDKIRLVWQSRSVLPTDQPQGQEQGSLFPGQPDLFCSEQNNQGQTLSSSFPDTPIKF